MGVDTGLAECGRNRATILSTYVSWLRRILPVDLCLETLIFTNQSNSPKSVQSHVALSSALAVLTAFLVLPVMAKSSTTIAMNVVPSAVVREKRQGSAGLRVYPNVISVFANRMCHRAEP